MSNVRRIESDVEIKAVADKFHEVYALKPYLISKMTPQTVKSYELHEGEWGKQGCILHWRSGSASGKERLKEIDDVNFSSVFEEVEGAPLILYKSMTVIAKATPKGDNKGSSVHLALEYEKMSDDVPDPHELLQLLVTMIKDISTYLAIGE